MSDNVSHPDHYTAGDVECIDAIKSALGPELFAGYLWGNAIKYLWRWPRKNLDEDLEKLKIYVQRIQDEGYSTPTVFDSESGYFVPNPMYELMNCGISVNVNSDAAGVHGRFT